MIRELCLEQMPYECQGYLFGCQTDFKNLKGHWGVGPSLPDYNSDPTIAVFHMTL